MIEAYMDECGIHEGAHVCAIAGYWGTERKWKNKFKNQWKEIIKDANEPSMTEFHAVEFWNLEGKRRGVFATWSDTKADKFIDDLANCIVESKVHPTSAMLVVDDWNKLNRDERTFLTGGLLDRETGKWTRQGAPNQKYFWPFLNAIVAPAANTAPGLHVHYTFDLNKQFKNYALDLFSLVKTSKTVICRHRLGALDFEIGEKAPGLQAADLFAYETYKLGKRRIQQAQPPDLTELSPLLRKLVTNKRTDDDFPFFDTEGLNFALSPMPPERRSPGWKPVVTRLRHHAT
jgi:hypothetical protein